ncbi:MAG: alpha/beta hydrolase [Candidatus Paceibacterota bacterium]
MPDTDNPQIAEWTNRLRELVGDFDKNTYFVGHSIGCQAILRFLEKTDVGETCGGVIMVAPWIESFGLETFEEKEVAAKWNKDSINFQEVKKKSENFFAIFSDNDPCVPLEVNKIFFEEALSVKIFIEENRRHFSGDDNINELPIVLNILKKI